MDNNQFMNDEAERTLESIDGINRAEMPPFFYTRLQAKLEPPASTPFWMLVTKPAVSLVTLSLLVVLNAAAISYYFRNSNKTVQKESSGIEKFAQAYDLNASSLYSEKSTR